MNIKNAKGVTLIALTITIIVLLILAGVSITSGLGLFDDHKQPFSYTCLYLFS